MFHDIVCCGDAQTIRHLFPAAWPLPATLPGNPWLLVLAIIAGTFIHEDIATVATGILVADGVTSVGVALPALYIGIVAGDLGLYGIGRLVALNRISRRLAGGRRFSTLKIWLDERLVAGVLMVRFLPGLRMPAYTTYGFFAMPFRSFLVSVIFAASIWTTGLFYLSYEFGALTADWLGVLRWPVIVIAAIVPLLAIERIVRGRVPTDVQDDEPS
ncbi:MAG: VTT domain-containing protein [Methyloceanibacter sp.]|nr:VTT domain-containing protein [Methyloceanibacter sp.]